ncbi:endothelin-converting enzyme 1 [Elysia marginata]|uniref:Endothelin-converting enzyme 1 n=1 Tax=Elysia marginata TaxID=1093978 RepID=A0AAV4J3U4_9GAST|nr:endothelin-converting enzyme 1 [Elysia marginata]
MTDVFMLLGAPNKTAVQSKMENVILFETELANITTPQEDRRDERKMYHKMTLANLIRDYPRSTLCAHALPRILNDYMLWHLVGDFASLLSKPFREAKQKFHEILTGTKGNEDAWYTCISDTDSVLGFAVGALFVEETFKGGSKEKAKEMIENVRTAFTDNLPNLDWMDDATRAAALDKANAVTDMIGYPNYILDHAKLDKKYEDLKINKSDYFNNNLAYTQYIFKKSYEKLRKTPLNEWAMSPPTVNAYYTPSKNTIVFPAGILQAPFYDQNFPKSLNYGAMGVVMGHELTHGFDDQGREYDKYGNMKSWWGADAVKKFKQKSQCMIDQYNNFELHGEHERGKQTLGENIADNGGLKSAYNVWCWNSKPESDHMQILTDPHSPPKFRVIGTLSNSEDFNKEFKCKSSAKMNPKKKCEIW